LPALPWRARAFAARRRVAAAFRSESEIDAIPVDAEAPDGIVATREMAVRDLIEEEVLLAIPYAPRHEDARRARTPRARAHPAVR
jgi:uncharacterized protein